jgi:Zn-dependent protease with chaperone function
VIGVSTFSLVLMLALLPVLVGLGAAQLAPRAARYLPPAAATLLLTATALSVALASGVLLCLACYIGIVDLIPAAHPVDWSAQRLHQALPMPAPAALVAGLVASGMLARGYLHLARVVRSARQTTAAAARLSAIGDLAVVQDPAVHAYAVPGRYGRVVVATGMLRTLSGPQRRALLAHEHAHLRYHHHRYAQLARLAAAANPLTLPLALAVDQAIERWADAAAVREVGDPATVAHALGLAALARPVIPPPALGAAHNDVVDRIRDLMDPPRRRLLIGILLTVATALCWASTATVVLYTHGVIELAEATHR